MVVKQSGGESLVLLVLEYWIVGELKGHNFFQKVEICTRSYSFTQWIDVLKRQVGEI